jgi:acetaldehyde dehydrogenase/alcohol dehydrogenase
MAHKLGAYHHIPHGVANALVLTYVMRYNANPVPVKMGTFPQYEYPHALERYCDVARYNGLVGKDDNETFDLLIDKLEELKKVIGIPASIQEFGVKEEDFLATLDEMTENAFNDQCTGANPRYPLMDEIRQLYLLAFYGKDTKEAAKI